MSRSAVRVRSSALFFSWKTRKAPEAPVITSPANNSTDTDGNFTLSGTAEPHTQVEPKDGGLPINQDDMALGATAGPDGTWSIELSNVSEGSHSYTVKSTDAGGNSAVSEAVTVIVDKP